MEASLYIHIPFCASLCDYCDFYSEAIACNDPLLDQFIDTLLADVSYTIETYSIDKVPTLYIGGGTPSFPGSDRLEKLFSGLVRLLPDQPEEITIEANPESLSDEIVQLVTAYGVNRLSLGIQSLNNRSREAVHRLCTAKKCRKVLERVVSSFPGTVSVDVIAGLPYETETTLVQALTYILELGIHHVSLYALTIDEDTPLGKRVQRDPGSISDESLRDALWITGRDTLLNGGLLQYEVSNFSTPGATCRHNQRYWQMKSWIGCGPAASGTIVNENAGTAYRYTNVPSIQKYQVPPEYSMETIESFTLMKESLMMGFRTSDGPDEMLFNCRFGVPIEQVIGCTLAKWRRKGFIEDNSLRDQEVDTPTSSQKRHLALNREGMLFLNSFLIECFDELDHWSR